MLFLGKLDSFRPYIYFILLLFLGQLGKKDSDFFFKGKFVNVLEEGEERTHFGLNFKISVCVCVYTGFKLYIG